MWDHDNRDIGKRSAVNQKYKGKILVKVRKIIRKYQKQLENYVFLENFRKYEFVKLL
jgi:hypothetical protein